MVSTFVSIHFCASQLENTIKTNFIKFQIFDFTKFRYILILGHIIKTNCIEFQIVDLQICAQFDFFEKGLGLVSQPHFVYDFSRKIFRILYSIN